ncbi:hypothetical protein [Actinosynnema sp. ALI-1.44]|uniref:hypothetical protein n=1 Tax=Actinosynnema sp. ALI-1.44 TaxID=1933779 RepID=UPI003F8D1877
MQAWKGVIDRARPYHRDLQLAMDRLIEACARAGRTDGPGHVGELVWDWLASRSSALVCRR